MRLNRVQRRFLSILGKGLGIALGSAGITSVFYVAYNVGLGIDHGDSVSASVLTTLLGGFVVYGLKAIWDRAESEIEYETRVVEQALKTK